MGFTAINQTSGSTLVKHHDAVLTPTWDQRMKAAASQPLCHSMSSDSPLLACELGDGGMDGTAVCSRSVS